MVHLKLCIILALIICCWISLSESFQIGAGIYDITGPASAVAMEGYANFNQTGSGIHFRLRARAFVFYDPTNNHRVAYVNVDLCFCAIVVKYQVVQKLQTLFGNTYTYDNVLISSIHTHSGPGGYSWYIIYDVMNLGYQKANVDVIVNGIVKAISQAHNSVKDANIMMGVTSIVNPVTNINRSPYSYLNNPASERAKYAYNVDKDMTLLNFRGVDNKEIGMLNWFAVHGTSMQNTNHLISGDNKGYAMYLFEQLKNGNNSLPGTGPFVAIFSNSNEGDVTPNTKGAFCPNGSLCDFETSTCGGESETCNALGPGVDDFDSTRIIGSQQYMAALNLYNTASTPITGHLNYIHQWVDMSQVQVQPKWTGLNYTVSTCIAALGDSFAAGTTDGPGDFDFTQGSNSTNDNPYWNLIGGLLSPPPQSQKECHHPKPILLYTGGIDFPAAWTPSVLPLQILQLGQLFIIGVPGEFTTMSGRRLRNAVLSVVQPYYSNAVVVISGLSNAYSQYVATPEEYDIQRYEGASTLFGPHTLPAYIQLYTNLAQALVTGATVPPGSPPKDWSAEMISILPGPDYDVGVPGTVVTQPLSNYKIGTTVSVTFVSSDPRNNFKTQDSYLYVQLQTSSGWNTVAVDGHWETKFIWTKKDAATESFAQILWDTSRAKPGTYQIIHNGTSLNNAFKLVPFSGTTNTFTLSL